MKRLSELERHILHQMWGAILGRVTRTGRELRDDGLPAKEAAERLESLLEFVRAFHTRFKDFERKGIIFN